MIAIRSTATFVLAAAIPPAVAAQQTVPDSVIRMYRMQQYAAAESVLRPAADAGNVRAIYWLGRIALARADAGAAIKYFQHAVQGSDTTAEYHLWLGRAYGIKAEHASVLKQPSLARRTKTELERAASLDPRNIDARIDLVTYYLRAPGFLGGGHDKARAMAGELRALSPYQGGLADAEIADTERDSTAATSAYETLVRSYPDSAAPVVQLAARDEHDQHWADAFAVLDRFLARRPNDPAALYEFGKTSALSGERLDAGERALDRYLSMPSDDDLPPYADAHLRLGMIQERLQHAAAAKMEYQTALALDPKLEDARKALARLQ